jgi:hypothetical protein
MGNINGRDDGEVRSLSLLVISFNLKYKWKGRGRRVGGWGGDSG